MKLFDYKCTCGELLETNSNEPPLCECGLFMNRVWTVTNVIFKGWGFTSNEDRPDYTEI